MSFYNMINGVTPVTFFILPMLGKHPDKYPRFRDCFISDENYPEYNNKIHVYTRVGGGNRGSYEEEIKELQRMPGYIIDYDDNFDKTFASFVFEVPKEWKKDYEFIISGEFLKVSNEYKKQLNLIYPKLKDKFDKIWEENKK